MKVIVNLLPVNVIKPRDLIYCYQEEATRVVNDMLGASPDGKTFANKYGINEPGITIQQGDPATLGLPPNNQDDGRLLFFLQFTKDQMVDMSLLDPSVTPGRTMKKTLNFNINAGQALDLLQNDPLLDWEFGLEGSGAELQGTLEKLN